MSDRCQNCGAIVSDDYARVMAGRDGRVHSCPNCSGGWDAHLKESAPPTHV